MDKEQREQQIDRIGEILSVFDLSLQGAREMQPSKGRAIRVRSSYSEATNELADLIPETPSKPTVITLCGSTKFKDAYVKANEYLTMQGAIVISVGLFGHADGISLTESGKAMLDELHLRKIDLADEIFVIDVGGYIGKSTSREIEYAKSHNKPVNYWSEMGIALPTPALDGEGLALLTEDEIYKCLSNKIGCYAFTSEAQARKQQAAYQDGKMPNCVNINSFRYAKLQVALNRVMGKEVWYWQGDGTDHIESLSCPVLIESYDLRSEVAAAVKAERDWFIFFLNDYQAMTWLDFEAKYKVTGTNDKSILDLVKQVLEARIAGGNNDD